MSNRCPALPDRAHCSGCQICKDVCSQKAIEMVADEHGFYFPVVRKEKCVGCGKCDRSCPILNRPPLKTEARCAFAGTHENAEVLYQSASGGAFSAVITAWKPDAVCGVKWNGFSAVNDIARDETEIRLFSKSKYILSDTNDVYRKAAEELKAGKRVVFSGAPCQVAAFRNYLGGADEHNLLLVDIVCHGAPSDRLLQMHLDELEKRKGKRIRAWSFRDKTPVRGKVSSRSARVDFEDGTWEHYEIKDDAFLKLYYNRVAYREACGNCLFARQERVSDITICDAHHIDELFPELTVQQGTSAVLFHSQKGMEILPHMKEIMDLREVDYDWIVAHNQQLSSPTKIHPQTGLFYSIIDKGDSFEKAVNISTQRSIAERIIGKIKKMVNARVPKK